MTLQYAFDPLPEPVVGPGEFVFAAVGLDHGHIHGMVDQLVEAGATLSLVYDPDPDKVRDFLERFPQARAAASEQEVLADPEVRLVASAAIASDRAPWVCARSRRARTSSPTSRRSRRSSS